MNVIWQEHNSRSSLLRFTPFPHKSGIETVLFYKHFQLTNDKNVPLVDLATSERENEGEGGLTSDKGEQSFLSSFKINTNIGIQK